MTKSPLLFLAALSLYAATPVHITDTIRSPVNYRTYRGTITITSKSALTCGAESFVKDATAIKVLDGTIDITLMPNDACLPAGSSYAIRYEPPLGLVTSETWVVPSSATPLTVSAVRATGPVVTPTAPIPLTSLASGGALSAQALCWSGTSWGPGDCGGGGGGTWGSITGTLSAQADLLAAFGLKQASIISTTDLTMRDLTAKSVTLGDGVTDGSFDVCTADGLACASLLSPVAAGSEPTCDVTVRGSQLFVRGGTGVADAVKVCAKTSGDTYAWSTL